MLTKEIFTESKDRVVKLTITQSEEKSKKREKFPYRTTEIGNRKSSFSRGH